MIVYESDLKKQAIEAMENCMGYLASGNIIFAAKHYGEACAFDEMLLDEGIDLEEENAHFKEMKEIFREKTS
jgi:hypothetical protein